MLPPLMTDRMSDRRVSHECLDKRVGRKANKAQCESQFLGNANRMMKMLRRKLMIESTTESPDKTRTALLMVIFVSGFGSLLCVPYQFLQNVI